MAWNGSDIQVTSPNGSQKSLKTIPTKKTTSVAVKACTCTIGLIGGLVAFVYFSGEKQTTEKSIDYEMKHTMLADVGTNVLIAQSHVDAQEDKIITPKTKYVSLRSLPPKSRDEEYEKQLERESIPDATTNRTFRTGTEQILSWIFSTELGDMPPPVPKISNFDLVHMQEILDLNNEVTNGDDEKTIDAKRSVQAAKDELKKYLEKGGNPDEFLEYYRDELQSAYLERKTAQQEVMMVLQGEPELASSFLKEVNNRLAKKGIKTIVISDRVQKRFGVKIEQ